MLTGSLLQVVCGGPASRCCCELRVAHAPVGNAKHSVTLTKYHTMQHYDAAYVSATQLFDTDITALVTQTPELTMEPLAKRKKVESPLERVTDGEHQSTTADELDVLRTMPEDTVDNQMLQPHGDQSEPRRTPRGRPEATHEREAHHTPAPWTLKVTSGRDVRRISLSKSHVTFSDALPVFATDRTIRLTAAATGQQVQLTSTRPRDPLAASIDSPSPRYWSRVLQTDQAYHRDTMARRQAAAVDKWGIDHLADLSFSCARHAQGPSCALRSSFALDLLSKSPEPNFVKAQCRVSGPKMRSSMLPGGSSNIGGARGHKQIRTRFSIVNLWDTEAVNVQGREAHIVARQTESTRSRPLAPDIPDVSGQTQQRCRKRNALHATAQVHPSSRRHTDIATPSASTPDHYPSHFSAQAPPDTEVDESEFPLCRRLGVNFHSSTTSRSSPSTLAHASHNQNGGGASGYIRFLPLCFFLWFLPLVSPRVAKCEQHDYSFALILFCASSPAGPSAHTTWFSWSLQ